MMWKLSMFQERTFHWLTRCLELTHSQATQSKVHLNATPTRINEIKEETTKDEVLLSLRAIIT